MSTLGVQRYDSAVEAAKKKEILSTVAHGTYLLKHSVALVEEAVKDWIKTAKKKPGANHHSVKFLTQVSAGQAAMIACRAVIDSATQRVQVEGSFARSIGLMIEHEAHIGVFKKEARAFWKDLLRSQKKATLAHKRKVFLAAARRTETTFEPWRPRDRLVVGLVMLDLILRSTKLIQRDTIMKSVRGKPKRQVLIKATPETLKWLEDAQDSFGLKLPVMLPTVDPPLDWSNNWDGGYTGLSMTGGGLMRSRVRWVTDTLTMSDCPLVLEGVNMIQRTGWEINPFTHQHLQEMWAAGSTEAGLPAQENEPLPEKYEGMDDDEVLLRKWKKLAAAVYDRNAERVGHRLLVSKTLGVANLLSQDSFYFPQKLDFRGRCYSAPNFLEPQGADPAKGLLQFETGIQVERGSTGADWLSLHAANMYGDDKLPIGERFAWAEVNREHIVRAATDPAVSGWWSDADKPWQFLACCRELAELFEKGAVESKLPVALDGSNNGLQIFSLLLRDPVGGLATNCIPSDEPQDIYQMVADRATEKLRKISEQWATDWIGFLGPAGLPRKAVKRPVMTLPYGAKRMTARDYVRDWYREVNPLRAGADDPCGSSIGKVADLVWDSIGEIVPLAVEAMGWLQQIAGMFAQKSIPLVWRTPVVNLTVGQAYYKRRVDRIETVLSGSVRRVAWDGRDTDAMSGRKMKDAISPNLIHSLDASAMYLTIDKAARSGVRDFAMVHDSFGTHAANASKLFEAVRSAYAEIFGGNYLEEWREQVQAALPDDVVIPPAPSQGTMDPGVILGSPYFFL